MARKTSRGFFSMKHNYLHYQELKIATMQNYCDQQDEYRRKLANRDAARKEKLLEMMSFFVATFDKKFPEISAEIQATLFKVWEKQRFNKELPQANIQIMEKLKQLGDKKAIKCWEKTYMEFRENS